MKRTDQYKGQFRPLDSVDRHVLDTNPDLQNVTFEGNIREATIIIKGLELLLLEVRRAEVTGNTAPLLPSSASVASLLAEVNAPNFEEDVASF